LPAFEPFTTISVPFPSVERLARKRRPALVVSRPRLARDHGLVWVLMITSAADARWPDDIPIDDLRRAGCPTRASYAPTKIATVETTHARRLGEVGAAVAARVLAALGLLLPVSAIALNKSEAPKSGVQRLKDRAVRARWRQRLARFGVIP
jgi:mRNA interferase MazF